MANLAEQGPTASAALVIDDHAIVQGWTPINGRRIDTNVHGVHFYKARPLEVYPTSIWKAMPEYAPDGEEILDYDAEEFLHLPEYLTPPENKAFEEGIAPTIQGEPSVWDYVSEEEYFGSKITLLTDHRLLRLATKYTMKQLAEKINAATEVWEPDLTSEKKLRQRLYERYIPQLAESKGMEVAEIRKELDDARRVNGVRSQKRRSSESANSSSSSPKPRRRGKKQQKNAVNDADPAHDAETKSSPALYDKHQHVLPWLKNQATTSAEEEKQLLKKKSKTSLKPLTIPDGKQDTATSGTPTTATPSTGELGPIPEADQAIFDGDPNSIVGATVYDLAIRYSVAEIQKRIVLAHPATEIKAQHAKKELYKYVGQLAKQNGKDRGEILDELNQARSAGRTNKKGLNGGFAQRKRKAVEVEDGEAEAPMHEGDIETADALEIIDQEMNKGKMKKKRKVAAEPEPATPTTEATRASSVPPSKPPATPSSKIFLGEWSPEKRAGIEVSVYTPSPQKSTGLRSPYFKKPAARPQPRFEPDTQINDLVDDIVDYIEQDTTPKLKETARSYGAALALDSPAFQQQKSAERGKPIEIPDSQEEEVFALQEVSPNSFRKGSKRVDATATLKQKREPHEESTEAPDDLCDETIPSPSERRAEPPAKKDVLQEILRKRGVPPLKPW
ncbi:hypothetical protein HII31_10449 [Pseudocercospora fuligena]|uniref:Uncharacterized protein n=1 Tax=Pseudocercospora fuligena TaxID=685502 RepID=A0A8H6RC08_9PEZI|nr:hypothetical protein HII31_10449 [Pseudocercospora fuligena]